MSFMSKNSAPAHSLQRTQVKGYKNPSGKVPSNSTTSNYLLEIFDSVIYSRCSMYRIIIFTVLRYVVNRLGGGNNFNWYKVKIPQMQIENLGDSYNKTGHIGDLELRCG